MKKGVCGTIELNTRLQSLLNPYSKPKNKLGFYKGDRVMQTVNDYDINVMNGSIGTIESIEWNGKSYQISVRFDDNEGAITTIKDFRVFNLILAYAITIHKSQGSEYPYIVMPVTSAHYIMLNRNLVYTGMTRAKTRTYMMIDDSGMTRALSTRLANRLTFLQDRIYEANFDYYSNDTLPNQ
jgi:exodeoxyribonuclease V alpha subunit